MIPNYSFIYIAIAVLFVVSIRKYRSKASFFDGKSEKILSLIYGFLFVFFYATGSVLVSNELLTAEGIKQILILCLTFTAPVGVCYHYLNSFLEKHFSYESNESSILTKHPILFPFIVIFACWLPVFLALYPGLFTYDVSAQIPQTWGSFNNHHPLLHTFYLKIFYDLGGALGSYNFGMAISVLIQMAVFALSLAHSIQYLVIRKLKKEIVLFVLIFFAIVPIFSVMAVSITKDVLFTAAFNAAFIKILKLKDNKYELSKTRDWVSIIVLLVLTALLRNNGKYAVYAVVIAIAVQSFITHVNFKKMSLLGITTILMITVINSALTGITDAQPANKNEMMSVPYQQIARVYKYNYEDISESDREVIDRLFPTAFRYNNYRSDDVKVFATVFSSSDNQKDFWNIYFKYLTQYPDRYIEAFLFNTMGYWYVDDVSCSMMYGADESRNIKANYGYFLMDTQPGLGVTRESKLPLLCEILETLFQQNYYQSIPVYATLFSMGVYLWMIVNFVFFGIQKRKLRAVTPSIYILFFMLTVFAGPCALIRYALPYIVCIPALMAMVYNQKCD